MRSQKRVPLVWSKKKAEPEGSAEGCRLCVLEDQFQGQLQRASVALERLVRLQERTTARGQVVANAGLAKRLDIVKGPGYELRVIEDVKRLSAELKSRAFGDG